MADIQALKAAVDAAYEAEAELLAERRENRATMPPADFIAYNEDTRQRQVDVQKAIDNAERDLQQALNNARQELLVGTLTEKGKANG